MTDLQFLKPIGISKLLRYKINLKYLAALPILSSLHFFLTDILAANQRIECSILSSDFPDFRVAKKVDLNTQNLSEAAALMIERSPPPTLQRHIKIWNTLVNIMSRIPFRRIEGRAIHILNLASGLGSESYVLSSFFGTGKFLQPSTKALVDSIDISSSSINLSKSDQLYIKKNSENGIDFVRPVRFEHLDGTESSIYASLINPIDVILLRHPYVTDDLVNGRSTWFKMIDNAVSNTRIGGIIIMTHYSVYESGIAEGILKNLGIELLISGEKNLATLDSRELPIDSSV